MTKYTSNPKSLILQLHITERCNLRCLHCYQNNYSKSDEMSFENMKIVIGQYLELIDKWKIKKSKARINITGGEPLLSKDFFRLVKFISKYNNKFEWSVFSNGILISNSVAKKLKYYGIHSCQISLEGLEKINDSIRGKGTYKKIINSIEILTKQNITVNASLTINKKNLDNIPALVNILNILGVSNFNTRRLVPSGQGKRFIKKILNKKEQFNYYSWTEKINLELSKNKQKLRINIGCDSGIFNNKKRKNSIATKNFCGIMSGTLLVVMTNGEVMPCRRLPIKLGNIFEKNIYDIWSSAKLTEIRSIKKLHKKCKKCKNLELCFGGAKCVSHTLTHDIFNPDILCKNI